MHQLGCDVGIDALRKRNTVQSFFIVYKNSEIDVYITPWRSPEEKPFYIAAMRAVLGEENGVEAYTFVTEAWVAKVNMRTQPELRDIPPRERSDREDVLFVISRHRDGENYATKYTVEYDEKGTVTLSEPEHLTFEVTEGLMGNLFDAD
jgi:hypothetical protein